MALLLVVRRTPEAFGYTGSRWTLASLLASCAWLRLETLSGLGQLLDRLGIRYKRGRQYVHSPDPAYPAKVAEIDRICALARAAPTRFVVVYLDELTYYRQPSVAAAYEARGRSQPLACWGYGRNTPGRILGTLNAQTGEVFYLQRSHLTTACLRSFWTLLQHHYAWAETIYVVLDNWPVHAHPDVLAPLVAQQSPWPPALPANWPTTSRGPGTHHLPIQLVWLPTYASWLNPIEKLWRWLKQAVLHLHRLSHDWEGLKQRIAAFLDQFCHGSLSLLSYVGLSPD
jgi:hypothetical protein